MVEKQQVVIRLKGNAIKFANSLPRLERGPVLNSLINTFLQRRYRKTLEEILLTRMGEDDVKSIMAEFEKENEDSINESVDKKNPKAKKSAIKTVKKKIDLSGHSSKKTAESPRKKQFVNFD